MMDGFDFKASLERIKAKHDADVAHRETCTEANCDRCGRYTCRCGGVATRMNGACESCRQARQRQDWSKLALSRIPRGFSEASLDAPWLVSLVGQTVIGEAREALDAERVVAVGPPGAGKTSLVAAMLVASTFPAPRRPDILWVSAHQLAKARAIHPLGEGEAPLIGRALAATVLVVDELGGEDQRYASAVGEVLFERHAEMQPTWVTTGVGPKEIADRYGGGIARRVFEDAKVFRLGRR